MEALTAIFYSFASKGGTRYRQNHPLPGQGHIFFRFDLDFSAGLLINFPGKGISEDSSQESYILSTLSFAASVVARIFSDAYQVFMT